MIPVIVSVSVLGTVFALATDWDYVREEWDNRVWFRRRG